MTYKYLLTALLMLICTAPAFATITGQELRERCNATSAQDKENADYYNGFCTGYIASFLDTYVLAFAIHKLPENNKLFCLPTEGIGLKDATKMAMQYLDENQQELQKSARSLLFKAFMAKYPCPNSANTQTQSNPADI